MITLVKKPSNSPDTAKDFYTEKPFVIMNEQFVYQLDNGYLVSRETAEQKGYTLAKGLQIPDSIKDLEALGEYLTKSMKLKRGGTHYMEMLKRFAPELNRPNQPHHGQRRNPDGSYERYEY